MVIPWGEALGTEEENKYRTEYSEVMMHVACTSECTVLSKYSYHGHVKLCIYNYTVYNCKYDV